MKKFTVSIIFIFIFLIIYFYWERVIQIKRNIEYGNFFSNEKTDIVFIGTSMTYHAFSPMYIWDKYGVISYNRGSSGQSYKMSYYLMKDAIEYHNAKVIVFDISYLLQAKNPYPSNINDIVNMIPLHRRYNAYKEIFGKDLSIEQINIASRFHDRWKELNSYDFISLEYWKGFIGKYRYPFNIYNGEIQIKNNKVKLFDETIRYAKLFQEYANTKDVTLIFIKIPSIDPNHGFAKAFEKLAHENNYIYFNYENMIDKIGYDYKTDLADKNHTNYEGGKKILDNLIPYIIKNYNIPNRKNDPNYASWNEDYIKYIRYINMQTIRSMTSFYDWKKQAFYDNYTVMLSANGDVLRKLPDTLKNDLKSFGLKKYDTNKANMRYAAIIDDNKVFFEEISNKSVTYKGRMKNIVNLLVSSDGKATINVSGKPRSKNKYGLNFVIYDKVNREIVDSIWIDPNKPDIVRR